VATVAGNPGVRHIYSVIDMEAETEKRRQQVCLSCDLGPGCLYNDAKFSPDGKYMILECLGPGIPRTELRYANNTPHEREPVLNTNPKLEEWMNKKLLPRVKHIEVPLPGGSFARVQLLLPEAVSESETSHHYPLVIEL
jgi:dipeptidyl-peptidase-4